MPAAYALSHRRVTPTLRCTCLNTWMIAPEAQAPDASASMAWQKEPPYGVHAGTAPSSQAVRVGTSRIHGLSLFAVTTSASGTRILPYRGEKIPKDESARRFAHGNAY